MLNEELFTHKLKCNKWINLYNTFICSSYTSEQVRHRKYDEKCAGELQNNGTQAKRHLYVLAEDDTASTSTCTIGG